MKQIGFAIVGCGAIGKLHAQVIASLSGAVLQAVYDVRQDAAEALGAKYGCRAYTDYDALLRDAAVDAVSICVPSGLHSALAIRAAQVGKHVVCEKPLDTDLGRAQAMADACKANGVTLFPVFQRRFTPAAKALKKAILEGKTGKILWGSAHVIWYRDDAYYQSGSWRGTAALDGGVLMNQAIHHLDLLLHFLGKPVSVRGKCAGYRGFEAEDTGVACIQFEGGALGVLEATTDAKPGLYSEISLYGEKGAVIFRNGRVLYTSLPDAPELEALREDGIWYTDNRDASIPPDDHICQYGDILAALQEGRAPLVTAEDALLVLETVLNIYKASNEDQVVFF